MGGFFTLLLFVDVIQSREGWVEGAHAFGHINHPVLSDRGAVLSLPLLLKPTGFDPRGAIEAELSEMLIGRQEHIKILNFANRFKAQK